MSCDYQNRAYFTRRPNQKKATTYMQMNQWTDYVKKLDANPYDSARSGILHSTNPELKFDLPTTPPKLATSPRERVKIPVGEHVVKHNLSCASPRRNGDHPRRYGAKSVPAMPTESDMNGPWGPIGALASGSDPDFNRLHEPVLQHSKKKYRSVHAKTTRYQKELLAGATPKEINDIVGYTLHTNTNSAPVHLGYSKSGGYDDAHKTFLKHARSGIAPSYPGYGPPRLRNGRVGGSWRHIKEVLQAGGSRIVFVDGRPRGYDNATLMSLDVPGSQMIQHVHRKGTSATPMLAADMLAHKGTQFGNWNVVR